MFPKFQIGDEVISQTNGFQGRVATITLNANGFVYSVEHAATSEGLSYSQSISEPILQEVCDSRKIIGFVNWGE